MCLSVCLSVSLCVYVCLSVCVSLCVCVSVCLCLSVCMCVCYFIISLVFNDTVYYSENKVGIIYHQRHILNVFYLFGPDTHTSLQNDNLKKAELVNNFSTGICEMDFEVLLLILQRLSLSHHFLSSVQHFLSLISHFLLDKF